MRLIQHHCLLQVPSLIGSVCVMMATLGPAATRRRLAQRAAQPFALVMECVKQSASILLARMTEGIVIKQQHAPAQTRGLETTSVTPSATFQHVSVKLVTVLSVVCVTRAVDCCLGLLVHVSIRRQASAWIRAMVTPASLVMVFVTEASTTVVVGSMMATACSWRQPPVFALQDANLQ
jgi:hypothetical protein